MKILENNLKIKNIHGCDISDFDRESQTKRNSRQQA